MDFPKKATEAFSGDVVKFIFKAAGNISGNSHNLECNEILSHEGKEHTRQRSISQGFLDQGHKANCKSIKTFQRTNIFLFVFSYLASMF